jgi:hypothetical protein
MRIDSTLGPDVDDISLLAVRTVIAAYPVMVRNLGGDVATGVPFALMLSEVLPSWFPQDYIDHMVRPVPCTNARACCQQCVSPSLSITPTCR